MTQKCFFNGNILTLEKNQYADYLLIENDKIVSVGSKNEIDKYIYDDAEMIDLKGKTLMPSFIDTHSHFAITAMSLLQANLTYAKSLDDIKSILIQFKEENSINNNQWIIANNYDNNFLKEKTHPTAEFIDSFLSENPVVLQHQTGNYGVFNTKAMEILNITNDRNGFLEDEFFTEKMQKTPMPSTERLKYAILKTQEKYASYGITTMQEGMLVDSLSEILSLIVKYKLLQLDLIGYVEITNGSSILCNYRDFVKKYKNRFKIAGYKIVLDGSPHSGTAWMLDPYKNTRLNGLSYYKNAELTRTLKRAITDNMQILVHCTGNAASEQCIKCYSDALKQTNSKPKIRPVIIHAQFLTKDQLYFIKQLGIIPSFFMIHPYYWVYNYINNFGKEKASEANIAKSTLEENVLFTFHQDTPTIEPNMLETIWFAVNRITKSDIILGENQRILPIEAIKAVTINAAYQYFEESLKGSLKSGKYADLVILDNDPTKVNPMDIKNIKVLETIKEGNTVYRLKQNVN